MACSRSSRIVCCSSLAASDPTPPRPVVHRARSNGVEPWSFVVRGSAPARKSASTAAEQRFRTARCSGVTPPLGSCVRVSARVDQIGDDRPLAGRVPVRGAGFTDDRRMQRFGAAPVAGTDVSASRNQITGKARRRTRTPQRAARYRLVDLRVTLGNEELVTARQAGGGQRRRSVKRCRNERVIARRDRD